MNRDEFVQHLINTHKIPLSSVENRSTMELISDHQADQESVISQRLGLSDHVHSEYDEVDGIPLSM